MQHIKTKYLGPTTHRGARIKASNSFGKKSITIAYPYELSGVECHFAAVRELVKKLGWDDKHKRMVYSWSDDEEGYRFLFIDDSNQIEIFP